MSRSARARKMHRAGSLSSTAPANLPRRPEGLGLLLSGTASTYSRPCSVHARLGDAPRPRKGRPREKSCSERQFASYLSVQDEERERVGARGRPASRELAARCARGRVAATALAACGAGSTANRISSAATKSEAAGGVHIATAVTVRFPNGGQGVIDGSGAFDRQRGVLRGRHVEPAPELAAPARQRRGVQARYLTERGDPVRLPADAVPRLAAPAGQALDPARPAAGGKRDGRELQPAPRPGRPEPDPDPRPAPGERAGEGGRPGHRRRREGDAVPRPDRPAQGARAPGRSDAAIDRVLAEGQPRTIPVDVWIGDGDGLVHQMRTSSSTQIGGQTVRTATLTRMSRWGMHVAVEAAACGRGLRRERPGERRGCRVG